MSYPAPTGRELAMEALLDREPAGDVYRLQRVLEEVVPLALQNRPLRVTPAALVEEAFCLWSPRPRTTAVVSPRRSVRRSMNPLAERRRLLLDWHVRMATATTPDDPTDGHEQAWTTWWQTVWTAHADTKLSSAAAPTWKVLQSRLSAAALEEDDDDEEEDQANNHHPIHGLQDWMAHYIRQEQFDEDEDEEDEEYAAASRLAGVWLLISLCLALTTTTPSSTSNTTEGSTDSSTNLVIPRCGHLLSVWQYVTTTNNTETEPLTLDPAVLEYWGKAAAVAQERWLAQRPSTLVPPAEMEEATNTTPAAAAVTMETAEEAMVVEPSNDTLSNNDNVEEGVASSSTTTAIPSNVASSSGENAAAVAAAAVVPPLSNIPNVSSDDNAEDDHDDSSDDHHEEDSDEEEESSSSSSSSSDEEDDMSMDMEQPAMDRSGDESQDNDGDVVRQDGGNHLDMDSSVDDHDLVDMGDDEAALEDDEDDDDYDTLRQALAISVHEESAAAASVVAPPTVRVVVNQSNDDTEEEPINDTPGSDGPVDLTDRFPDDDIVEEEAHVEEETEPAPLPLPTLPDPPSQPAFASYSAGGTTSNESNATTRIDGDSIDWQAVYDPSNEAQFGALPCAHVLVHLIRYAQALMASSTMLDEEDDDETDESSSAWPIVASGMGGFLYNRADPWDEAVAETVSILSLDKESAALIFQLATTSLVSLCQRRNEALQQFRRALEKEQRAMQGDASAPDDHPADEKEEDDPATAFAMSHVEDADAPLSIEVLQNKGMRRKAAAAAHDAASLLRTLRKEKEKLAMALFDDATAILEVLRFLRMFLHMTLQDWLSSKERSVRDLGKLIAPAVRGHLRRCLEQLMEPAMDGTEIPSQTLHSEIVLALYRESLFTWSEAAPFIFDSGEVSSVYVALLEENYDDVLVGASAVPFESVDSLSKTPIRREHRRAHRLQVLSRRFKIDDVLEGLVGTPIPWFGDKDLKSKEAGDAYRARSPNFPATLFSSLRKALLETSFVKEEIECFYKALCHRVNTKILLFDGLYAIASTEPYPISPVLSPAKRGLDASGIHVHANPGPRLLFDSTNCADSIAIVSGPDLAASSGNGPSVNQRASKVWGTVLSTQYFSPKTGIHRWAVKLEKCERGHVFIGVSTSQCSVRTYVGGDKHGWGMIGTQALWHDRRKVRGDYGGTFRTGATIIVTLDTDAGTLSFGSWKSGQNAPGALSDPLVQNILSPKRQSLDSGGFDDWGIAFEGLPLDSRLFPAVGLYQRDDKVTLLPVDSGSSPEGSIAALGGICFYPDLKEIEDEASRTECEKVRNHNFALFSKAVNYACDTVDFEFRRLSKNLDCETAASVLRSLLGSICLIPSSVPLLSTRCAMALLPKLTSCFVDLAKITKAEHKFIPIESGEWVIMASPGSGGLEEYKIKLEHVYTDSGIIEGFKGHGVGTTGKSKNGYVSLYGNVHGTSINFVENWAGEKGKTGPTNSSAEMSACVVSARLSLRGTKFEGSYKNVNVDSSSGGQIVGFFVNKGEHKDPRTEWSPRESTLLSIAVSRLATTISHDSVRDFSRIDVGIAYDELVSQTERKPALRAVLRKRLLATATVLPETDPLSKVMELLKQYFAADSPDITNLVEKALCEITIPINENKGRAPANLFSLVEEVDPKIAPIAGGFGSLRVVCPNEYDKARKHVVAALLHSAGVGFPQHSDNETDTGSVALVWRKSLQIMEDTIRHALAKDFARRSEASKEACHVLIVLSEFILKLSPFECFETPDACIAEIQDLFAAVKDDSDIDVIETVLTQRAVRSTLSLVGVQSILKVLSASKDMPLESLDCLIAALPQIFAGFKVREVFFDDDQPSVSSFGEGMRDLPLGSSLCLRQHLQDAVQNALRNVLTQFASRSLISESMNAPLKSLYLSGLATFASSFSADHLHLIRDILPAMSTMLSAYREVSLNEKPIADGLSITSGLVCVVDRDVSRAILRSATAVAHASLFFASTKKQSNNESQVISRWLLSELQRAIEFLESSFQRDLSASVGEGSLKEWKDWAKNTSSTSEEEATSFVAPNPGLQFFVKHGTLHTMSQMRLSGKDSTAQAPPASGDLTDTIRWKIGTGFRNRHLAHWLHILCVILRSEKSLEVICADSSWISVLLTSMGLDCTFDGTTLTAVSLRRRGKGVLPARHRARLIALSFPFFYNIAPNEAVIHGLLSLAGLSCLSMGVHDEEHVSKVAISLLRKLHSPLQMDWRQLINRLLPTVIDSKSLLKRAGARAMFGGSLNTISPLCRVLLKPVAATAISKEGSSSQGKSQTAVAPAQVPVGADYIVSGLMRHTAEGGIVSSVDRKSGICEVILMPRNHTGDESDGQKKGRRRSLTVRALRTHSSDLVIAEEEALVLDDSVPTVTLLRKMLPACVDSLLSATSPKESRETKESQSHSTHETLKEPGSPEAANSDGSRTASVQDVSIERLAVDMLTDTPNEDKNLESDDAAGEIDSLSKDIHSLTVDLMALKSCILILSDTRTLEEFIQDEGSVTTLSRLLTLAWPEQKNDSALSNLVKSARMLPIASLSWHEAKYSMLSTCLREVSCRSQAIRLTAADRWKERAVELASEVKTSPPPPANEDSTPTDEVESNQRTPPSATNTEGATESQSNRNTNQSSVGSNSDDEEDQAGDNVDVQHLREAAIVQMAELGIPRPYAELALRRVGGTNIEAAVHFCLEHEAEIERMLADEMSRQASGRSSSRDPSDNSHLLNQLLEMGFKRRWCIEALANTGNNVDEALTWILTNTEMLETMYNSDNEGEEENAEEEEEEDESEEEDETDEGETPQSEPEEESKDSVGEVKDWALSVVPLRLISGKATIDPKTLEVTGQPNGGFASVGMKGVLLQSGKFYYEVVLGTAGCIQIGFADSSFAAHCNAERGDGCGDSSSSFSFDGWRRLRWHATATEWGCRWQVGDVIGCLVDIENRQISFTINGQGEEVGMGVAFSGFDFCGGLYPVVSFNRKESVRLILGGSGEPFKCAPPAGYQGVGEALPELIKERLFLLGKEKFLREISSPDDPKGFLCDYSDEEHGHELFSWSHRYYGSDASVHLGSVRRHSGMGRSSSKGDSAPFSLVGHRLKRFWSEEWAKISEEKSALDGQALLSLVMKGYQDVRREFSIDIFNESISLALALAKKLLLHLLLSSKSFKPGHFFGSDGTEHSHMIRLVKILEVCAGARNWTGEASAMAMAAESLGLGVQVQSRSSEKSDPDDVSLHPAGYTQVLSSIMKYSSDGKVRDTSTLLAAAAEASLASDGSACLVFLMSALQEATSASQALRNALLAAVSRGVRFLALVDDTETKTIPPGEGIVDGEEPTKDEDLNENEISPDAKLISFYTGLFLNDSVLASDGDLSLLEELFGAWSVGLLSASLPWRMISAQTCSGILSKEPNVFTAALTGSTTLARFYGRLPSTVVRRVWAERAAIPVCSRYLQAMIELLATVRRSVAVSDNLPEEFLKFWKKIDVEASCPRPLSPFLSSTDSSHPLDTDGIMIANEVVWTGALEFKTVEWKKPTRSSVRNLMDGGEGPPMLRAGCLVMRGPDWKKTDENKHVDGYEQYESEKSARSKSIKSSAQKGEEGEKTDENEGSASDPASQTEVGKKKRKKPPHPKLPLGVVVSVEPWNGVPALGRRVRWVLTGNEGVYRFGGDGGRFDIMHVETNQKRTRVVKKYPFPETAEQCASRKGFGMGKSFSVILRLPQKLLTGTTTRGILEIPDFGAGLDVECEFGENQVVTISERGVLYGQKDSGWEARFGQPSYISGTKYELQVLKEDTEITRRDGLMEKLAGSTTFDVESLRNPADGSRIRHESSLHLKRCKPTIDENLQRESSSPPPLSFDPSFHATNLSISEDQRTVVCSASDGRGCAFASTGFSKGVHYWEVTLGQVSESGSIFVGCAEKPTESPPRLNRWLGWGFVNFRATYAGGSERVYGVHAHTGDVIGVLLDCDAGRLSFFYDGLKYGEHIISDLGCAYENLAPFGFSAEGCGMGGHGQAAPNGFLRSSAQGFVKPRTLYPVVGLKNHADRVTFSPIWSTTYGMDATSTLRNVLAVEEILHAYGSKGAIPDWFMKESFSGFQTWRKLNTSQIISRGSRPYRVELDTSPLGCARACAVLGLDCVLLPGDRIRLKRSFGRLLELAEDAVILGQDQLRLFYRIVAQKNEGQSLSEGAYLPHYFHEFDVVDGIEFLSEPKGKNIKLPKLDRFRCSSDQGLKVVFSGGAVVRSDLEITDLSPNLGTIPEGTLIPPENVLDRRMNSCGILRYKVRCEDMEGYISAHIQGGSEEAILTEVESPSSPLYDTPDSAALEWHREWVGDDATYATSRYSPPALGIEDFDCFRSEFSSINNEEESLKLSRLDCILAEMLSVISDHSDSGDGLECTFEQVLGCLTFARSVAGHKGQETFDTAATPLAMKHAVAELFASRQIGESLPSLATLMARVSFLRALNRRVRYALPWLTLRPIQEGSSVLGGSYGMGCCVDKAGRSWQPPYSTDRISWIQPPSIGQRLRDLRGLILSNIKREFLSEVALATTTPTPLSHDEYELPREIRTVRVNRMRAARVLQSREGTVKRKYSVFSQLQSETRNLGGAALRRGYLAKGHGGQKRAFRVKLVGEGVNDYSGPYREVFADAFAEIVKTDEEGAGVLGVLDASPNRAAEIGEDRDLYMFSLNGQQLDKLRKDFRLAESGETESAIRQHFASLISPRNEASREVEESLVFLGRLTGTAYRHGIPVDLPLPMQSVWKALVEESPPGSLVQRLKELDILAAKSNSPQESLLWWQQRMLNAFVDGLANVIPVELLPLLSAEELRGTLCGNTDVDVDVLKAVVEYEGYTEEDAVIGYFWQVLREATNADRRSFLQYVWARSRLPLRVADFESPFKILKDSSNTGDQADQALPSASTCFFSLTLPEYSSADILKEKLMYAIHNVTTMETDFQTNSSEIAEGYRAL